MRLRQLLLILIMFSTVLAYLTMFAAMPSSILSSSTPSEIPDALTKGCTSQLRAQLSSLSSRKDILLGCSRCRVQLCSFAQLKDIFHMSP